MNITNLKDKATNIAGILIAISGAIYGLVKAGIDIPQDIQTASVAAGIIGAAIISYFTGKNPDGSTKTADQVAAQNPK